MWGLWVLHVSPGLCDPTLISYIRYSITVSSMCDRSSTWGFGGCDTSLYCIEILLT